MLTVLVVALLASAVPSVAFVHGPFPAYTPRLVGQPGWHLNARCNPRPNPPAAGVVMGAGLARRTCAALAAVGIWWGGVLPRANAEPWSLQAERPAQSRGWDPFADEEDYSARPQPRPQQRAQPKRQDPPISQQLSNQADSAKESWDDFQSDLRYLQRAAPRLPRWAGEVGGVAVKIAGAGVAGGAVVFAYTKVETWRTERVRRGLKGATGVDLDGSFLDGKGYWRSPDAPVVSGTYRGPAPPPMTTKYAFPESRRKSPEEVAALSEQLTVNPTA